MIVPWHSSIVRRGPNRDTSKNGVKKGHVKNLIGLALVLSVIQAQSMLNVNSNFDHLDAGHEHTVSM